MPIFSELEEMMDGRAAPWGAPEIEAVQEVEVDNFHSRTPNSLSLPLFFRFPSSSSFPPLPMSSIASDVPTPLLHHGSPAIHPSATSPAAGGEEKYQDPPGLEAGPSVPPEPEEEEEKEDPGQLGYAGWVWSCAKWSGWQIFNGQFPAQPPSHSHCRR